MNKVVKYYKDNKTSIWKALYQNYLYGFLGWMIPVTVLLGNPIMIFIMAAIYYKALSIIINRDKYITNMGKFFWLPYPAACGALTAHYIGELLKYIGL